MVAHVEWVAFGKCLMQNKIVSLLCLDGVPEAMEQAQKQATARQQQQQSPPTTTTTNDSSSSSWISLVISAAAAATTCSLYQEEFWNNITDGFKYKETSLGQCTRCWDEIATLTVCYSTTTTTTTTTTSNSTTTTICDPILCHNANIVVHS